MSQLQRNGLRKDTRKRTYSKEESIKIANDAIAGTTLRIGKNSQMNVRGAELLPETTQIIATSDDAPPPLFMRTKSKPRTKVERQQDLVLEARMYLQGYSMREIREILGNLRPYKLAEETIFADINDILNEWRKAYIADIDILKAQELQHINMLERAYWEGYERSLRDAESITSTQLDDRASPATPHGKPLPTLTRRRTTVKKDKRDGDPEFLNGVRWCIEQRCKILGINAPEKIAIQDWREEAKKAGYKPEALSEAFNEMVKLAISSGTAQNAAILPPSKLNDL